MARRGGFTYIELTVALMVLLLVVGIVSPNLKNLAKAQEIGRFKTELKALPTTARELAVSRGQTVEVSYDDQESRIVVQAVDETAAPGQSDDSSERALRTIAVPPTVRAKAFLVEGSDADAGSWAIRFYADGTSEAGGIGFEAGTYEFALTVRADGRGAVVDGDVPDLSTQKWRAGDFEQRAQ